MLNRRLFLIGAAAAIPLAGLSVRPALAATPKTFAPDGLAIKGYDPVAYFTEEKPVEGSADFTHEYNGATWRFASAENRDMFVADPEAYAPQYGGYCAFALSKNAIATSDPDAWTVYEGKLYLNYSLKVRGFWLEDVPGNIALADANWPSVLEK
ncbi:YHS domain-containing protein [Alphaproteobacteria bacterium KMM 3653]|uniref:YHS domain-containing protein n=1 Tax=Harenicola maris TaxID=2841044 RepID=A0AAP2CM79_9RHOB|nr:YHS domain-containing protein [Harenicola maris]